MLKSKIVIFSRTCFEIKILISVCFLMSKLRAQSHELVNIQRLHNAQFHDLVIDFLNTIHWCFSSMARIS